MATRTTKLELEQLLAKRNEELIAARTEISVLRGQLEMLQARPAARGEQIVATYTRSSDGVRMNKVRIGFNTFAHRPA